MKCLALEAMCTCLLPEGHREDYHECKCGGRWPLSWSQANAFTVMRIPRWGPFGPVTKEGE